MKVKLRHILIIAAIDDEAIAAALQVELLNQALSGLDDLRDQLGIGRGHFRETAQGFFRNEEDVNRAAGLGMMKGQ